MDACFQLGMTYHDLGLLIILSFGMRFGMLEWLRKYYQLGTVRWISSMIGKPEPISGGSERLTLIMRSFSLP
jgi:hypothetical protein